MNDQEADSEELRVYAVRLQERATRDINAVYVSLAETVSLDLANAGGMDCTKEWQG